MAAVHPGALATGALQKEEEVYVWLMVYVFLLSGPSP
jgi:hypothetical protein